MKESAFSYSIRKDISSVYPDSFVYLIQDAYRTGKKPFDFFFLNNDVFYAIELKVVKGASISFDIVREIQIQSLAEVKRACKNITKSYIVIKLENKSYSNRMMIFTIKNWKLMLKENKSVKSLKIEHVLQKNYAAIFSRIKTKGIGTHWPVNML